MGYIYYILYAKADIAIVDILRCRCHDRFWAVNSVRQTAEQMMRRMLPGGIAREIVDPSGAVGLVQPDVSSAWVGTSVTAIEERLGVRVAWISRGSGALVPTGTTLIQEHDRLHLAVATERLTAVQRALSRPPVQEV